jgi:hypothetical protein
VQPIQAQAQFLHDAPGRTTISAEAPGGHVVSKSSQDGAERHRGRIAGQPAWQHQDGVAVTAARCREHRPQSGEGSQVQRGPRRFSREPGQGADAMGREHLASIPGPVPVALSVAEQ